MDFTQNCMCISMFRAAGLRRTILRVDILNVLKANSGQRLDVDEINKVLIEKGSKVPMSALYRTLKDFSKHDLIMRDWKGGFSKKLIYRLKSDYALHEYSIMCRSCETKISKVSDEVYTHLRHIAIKSNLKISYLSIIISMVCDECARK